MERVSTEAELISAAEWGIENYRTKKYSDYINKHYETDYETDYEVWSNRHTVPSARDEWVDMEEDYHFLSIENNTEGLTAVSRASYRDGKPCNNAIASKGRWYISINSLRDLQDLIKEVGSLIIDKDYITIYDDYVE